MLLFSRLAILILSSQDRISNPVGTTIRVQDFLSSIPVRRQTVLKSANKILSRIKLLLQDYAIAKPTVRISFKVLKAKNDKGNWSYVPKKNATALDAADQVYSRPLSAALSTVSWPKDQHPVNSTSSDSINSPSEVMRINALLPLPTCGRMLTVLALLHHRLTCSRYSCYNAYKATHPC